jgi:hypothetical protein
LQRQQRKYTAAVGVVVVDVNVDSDILYLKARFLVLYHYYNRPLIHKTMSVSDYPSAWLAMKLRAQKLQIDSLYSLKRAICTARLIVNDDEQSLVGLCSYPTSTRRVIVVRGIMSILEKDYIAQFSSEGALRAVIITEYNAQDNRNRARMNASVLSPPTCMIL